MKKLYLMRHGQTEFNEKGLVQGWSDSPLTRLGKEQALKVGEWFRKNGIHIDAAFSSDLQRAVETMQIVSPTPTMFATPLLREISFGKLDGTDGSLIDQEHWDEDYLKYEGESIDACLQRVYQCLNQVMNDPRFESVLMVSHGFPVASMYQILPKRPDKQWKESELIDNAALLEYSFDPEKGFMLENLIRIKDKGEE